jgi:hypothetical protein
MGIPLPTGSPTYCDHGNAIKIAEKKNITVSLGVLLILYEYYFLKKFVRD